MTKSNCPTSCEMSKLHLFTGCENVCVADVHEERKLTTIYVMIFFQFRSICLKYALIIQTEIGFNYTKLITLIAKYQFLILHI